MDRMMSSETLVHDEEDTLRPQSLREYIGQSQLKKILRFLLKRRNKEVKLWIMYYFMVLLV